MPAIPAWLISAFWQYGVPLIIAALRKAGAINWAEALAGRMIAKLTQLKTYSAPSDYPNPPPDLAEIPEGSANTNLVVGQKPDDDFPSPHGRDSM